MNIQYYKGRVIDFTKSVMIYKNLHNGLFSVKQNDLVVAHVKNFELTNVTFKVLESGRQRVIKEKRKNVHAFICGFMINRTFDDAMFLNIDHKRISYNPYKSSQFYHCESGTEYSKLEYDNIIADSQLGLFLAFKRN